MPRLRFSLEAAKTEAVRLASEYLVGLPNTESLSFQHASPDYRYPKNESLKHPIRWLIGFVLIPPEPGDIQDGGELFIAVDLETKVVGLAFA